jgi:AcrR family transcriptional regulator
MSAAFNNPLTLRKRKRGRPPNPALRAAKHARMLSAAMELFISHGYEHVTVEQIAQAASQSKGAFYWYFKDKEDCLRQIISRISSRIEAIAEGELRKGGTAGEKLLRITDLSNWRENEISSFVMLFDSMIFSLSSTVRDLGIRSVGQIYHALFRRLKELGMAAARERGWSAEQIKSHDFDHWAFLILACYNGIFEFSNQKYFDQMPEMERTTKVIHSTFIHPIVAARRREHGLL